MNFPKAVLLDRDGVINFDLPNYILSPDQWNPIPGSLEAIAQLIDAGITIAICSNQSALARGKMDEQTFRMIHAKMLLAIEEVGGLISHVSYCPHGPEDSCLCRKPLPGLLIEALQALNMETKPSQAIMIGDSLRDIEAANAAGVPAMLVQSGYGDADSILEKARLIDPNIQAYPNLADAVQSLLQSSC